MPDNGVETISSLVQWRIDNLRPCQHKLSDPFKMGIWNWRLSVVEKSLQMLVGLYPEQSRDHPPPLSRFKLTVSTQTLPRKSSASPIFERLFQSSSDFQLFVDCPSDSFVIEVEFLDLKSFSSNAADMTLWTKDRNIKALASESTLQSISRILHEGIHADVTIRIGDGSLEAHKAILAASSPILQSMFHHDLREKESSKIDIEDMNQEACKAFLGYLYGTIEPEDFLMHRMALLGAANKYEIPSLKSACEESLLEDINTGNVLARLQDAFLYQLDKLKKGCFKYLFEFGKIYDVKDQMNDLLMHANRELVVQLFNGVLAAFRSSPN